MGDPAGSPFSKLAPAAVSSGRKACALLIARFRHLGLSAFDQIDDLDAFITSAPSARTSLAF